MDPQAPWRLMPTDRPRLGKVTLLVCEQMPNEAHEGRE
jgi:hypothetical protein